MAEFDATQEVHAAYDSALLELGATVVQLRKDNKILADTVTQLATRLKLYEESMPPRDEILSCAEKLEHARILGGPLGYGWCADWLRSLILRNDIPIGTLLAVDKNGNEVGRVENIGEST
jgi:hypothetical protein